MHRSWSKSNSSKCRFPCISQKMAAIVFTAQVYIQNQIPYTLSLFLPTTLFTKRSTRFTGESSRLRSVGRVRTVRYRSRLASFGAPNRGCECKKLRDGGPAQRMSKESMYSSAIGMRRPHEVESGHQALPSLRQVGCCSALQNGARSFLSVLSSRSLIPSVTPVMSWHSRVFASV